MRLLLQFKVKQEKGEKTDRHCLPISMSQNQIPMEFQWAQEIIICSFESFSYQR